jgi:hypothetical protein
MKYQDEKIEISAAHLFRLLMQLRHPNVRCTICTSGRCVICGGWELVKAKVPDKELQIWLRNYW